MKNVFKLRNAVLVAAIASSLAACGGGSDGAAAVGSISGVVADGYVSGATVTLDADDNGICASGEPTTTTNASGAFTFAGRSGSHVVCATSGTDISTGAPFVGTLVAPPSASPVLTPLSTLVKAKVDADNKLAGTAYSPAAYAASATAAATTIAANLGLTGASAANLLTADPVALAATNPKLTQTTVAVQTLLIQAANSVAAGATGTTVTAAQTAALYDSAVSGLATAVAAQVAPVDLTVATTAGTAAVNTLVTAAISNTVTEVKTAVTAGNAAMTAAFTATATLSALAPASVAAVSAANVTSATQVVAAVPAATLVAAPVTGVTSVALAAQQDTTAAQTTALMGSLLTTTAAAATVTNSATTLQTLSASVATALSSGSATAAANLVNTQITTVSNDPLYTAPVIAQVVPPTLPTLTNVLVLSAPVANPGVNQVSVDTTASPYSVTVMGQLTSAAITIAAVGTPVLAANAMVGIDVTEVSPGTRSLQLIIDQVALTGTTVTIPATATLYARGVHTNGTVSVAALTNVASNVLTSTGGVMTVNWSTALTSLAGTTGFANLGLVRGTYDVTVAMSGAPLAKQTSIANAVVPADAAVVTIPASTAISAGASVAGSGQVFRVTVQ